jgi:hypothetical protein
MGTRIAIAGSLLIAVLGVPRPSEAGLLEIIWEMSGPQMLGLGYGCMYSVRTGSLEQCRLGAGLISRDKNYATKNGPFLVLGGSILGSTGKDSRSQGYDWGEIWMLALEPGVAMRSYDNQQRDIQVHHGVGISYDVLFGDDIRRFDKFAITVTPVDVAFRRVAFGVKLRMYPNGFTDDEFKPGPRVSKNRPFETTLGFTFNLILDKH